MNVKLSDIASLISEMVVPFKGKRKYVATGSLDDDENITGEYIKYNNRPSRANIIVKINDVCFAKMKNTKKVLLINKNNSNYIYSTGFAVLRPNVNRILPEYLFYIINSKNFQFKKNYMCTGATQKAITNNKINQIKIFLPTIKEQKFVVRILDIIKIIIEKRKLNTNKLEYLSSSTFTKFFGKINTNSKKWEIINFGEIIDGLTDYHANGSYKILKKNVKLEDKPNYALMLRTADLENNNFTDKVKYINKHAYDFLKKSKVFGEEIIINKIGSAGNVYLVPNFSRPVSLGMNSFLLRIKKHFLV